MKGTRGAASCRLAHQAEADEGTRQKDKDDDGAQTRRRDGNLPTTAGTAAHIYQCQKLAIYIYVQGRVKGTGAQYKALPPACICRTRRRSHRRRCPPRKIPWAREWGGGSAAGWARGWDVLRRWGATTAPASAGGSATGPAPASACGGQQQGGGGPCKMAQGARCQQRSEQHGAIV